MIDLKQLLADLAGAIVDHPEEVYVKAAENGDSIVFELHVAESDMGKVIGRHGKIAKSIRLVMKSAANTQNKKAIVEIK